jgi:transcriptional regulator with XRE-family HTH domain
MPRRKQPATGFGKRLLELRKARGLTQVELAELTGSTQRAISYYENEAGFPPSTAVIVLAKALLVTTDELLGLEQREPGPLEADPNLRRMWKRFQQIAGLPERDQRAVIRLINSLAAAQQAVDSAPDLRTAVHG